MTNLKRICEEVIAAGEKAIKTPYKLTYLGSILTPKGEDFGRLECSEYTRDYILLSANHADKLARALLVMEEALKWIMPKVHQGNHEGSFEECGKATCVEYRRAFAQAEEILK